MKYSKTSAKAAILSMSVVQMGVTAIAPILADIQGAFPGTPPSAVQFLMTFPNLMVIGVSLLAAAFSKRIPKKYFAAVGCALFSVSGVLSWLFHDSVAILFVWAGMMGIGIGLVVPMAPSLVTDCFTGKERQSVMGMQSSAANVGAMLMTFAGGLLAKVSWNCNYLVYLIAIPGLILSLTGLPVHPGDSAVREKGEGRQKSRDGLKEKTGAEKGGTIRGLFSGSFLLCCVLALLITMLFNSLPANLSMHLTERSFGASAETGIATTLLLLGGTLGGILFGKLTAALGKRVMALGFGLLTVGFLLCAFAPNVFVLYIGCLLGGGSISLVMPRAMLDASQNAGEHTGLAAAIVMAVSNLGGFLTPVLTIVVGAAAKSDAVTPRFFTGAGISALIAVLILLVPLFRKKS